MYMKKIYEKPSMTVAVFSDQAPVLCVSNFSATGGFPVGYSSDSTWFPGYGPSWTDLI